MLYNPTMLVSIPPELEPQLIEAARRSGLAPEEFALAGVREALSRTNQTLFDAFADVIGSVESTPETRATSFTDSLLEKKRLGRL
jgi:hypothetical protein